MVLIAQAFVVLCGVWLVAVSLTMIYKPKIALLGLSKMASTSLINYTELALRLLAGVAFIISAPSSSAYLVFHYFGWFLVVSAIALMIMPREWHRNYTLYWTKKLSPFTMRSLGPLSLVAGLAILKTVT